MSQRERVQDRIDRLELPFNQYGVDPYGISKWHLRIAFETLGFLYHHYFSVHVSGTENVPKRGRAMLIGNHSGGVALDAAMVLAATFFEMDPPRLAQSMVEKFLNKIPIASLWTNRIGQFTGLPEHASRLLDEERLLMVFPEGVRGTAKLFHERHSLVEFGTGFMRLAIKSKAPIVPFAFVGGGEAIPTVFNAYRLGKTFGVPYLPLTPYGLPLPLPVPLVIQYGAPMMFEGTGNEDDAVIGGYVSDVKQAVQRLIDEGREKRKGL